MANDLIERLERLHSLYSIGGTTLQEAAEALAARDAEIARLKAQLAEQPGRIADDEDETCAESDLWDKTPGCDGKVLPARGGGVRCSKCDGWFCY